MVYMRRERGMRVLFVRIKAVWTNTTVHEGIMEICVSNILRRYQFGENMWAKTQRHIEVFKAA